MASEGTDVSGLAARYAAALFDLADERKALEQTASDLTSLKTVFAQSEDLRRLARSPLYSRADQSRAMEAILVKAGVSELTRQFIGLVAANRRLFALMGMIDAFLKALARRRGEMTAYVTSARALSKDQVAALTKTLHTSLGSKVDIAVTVDPSLVAGLVVRVGSRMIDSSVRTKLDKLQLAMKGVG